MREGWGVVRKDEFPDFEAPVLNQVNMKVCLEWAIAARIPNETVAERNAYFAERDQNQQDAVDHDMMRENAFSHEDRRTDRQFVTFGGPRKS